MRNTFILLTLVIFSTGIVDAQAQSKTKKSSTKKAKTTPSSTPKAATAELAIPYRVDKAKSEVIWEGKKVGGRHYGKVSLQDGTLLVSNGKILRGNMVVDMNSISCEDIKDPEYNGKLIGHLKAADFFNTEMFPQAILDITSVKSLGGKKLKIIGTLNIKGMQQPTSFNAVLESMDENSLKASGQIVFDRTKYDIKYGSTLFGAAVDKAIEDNVVLNISIVANTN